MRYIGRRLLLVTLCLLLSNMLAAQDAYRLQILTEYLIDTLHWPTSKMLLTRDFDDNIRMLAARRVDLAMMVGRGSEELLEQRGFDVSQFRLCLEIAKPVAHLYYSFSLKTDDHIVNIFKRELEAMFQDGSYQRLYQIWYNELPAIISQ